MLLGRQREMAALKVVGSGVDASAVGTGKTISSGRALAHRASTQPRFRGLVVAEGRLLGQWREELTRGAPGRGLPPLAPNLELLVLSDDRQIAGQIRRFDRELGDRPGVVLAANSVLDRYPADLQAIPWHLLIADEALRYANPATEAHQALAQLRFGSVADCWLLTATPRGKTAEHLDVLVGLAVGDEAMIAERLNTREAGDLMDEINAHRLRVNYGPHLVRVTRRDMQAWMPEVRPAQPLALDPDPALQELLDAIRQGGREAYRRLLEVLRELKTLEAGSELYKSALAELARAQGIVLGNVGVFVDASVDPETLTHSKAALATALVRQGLVAEAIRGGGDGLPLLRGVTAQTLAGVAGEEQVIVFGERVWCLRQLAATLRERHGIEAHVADGSIDPREFEALKRRFTAGEFPVLCLSRIGHEGHNLQNASVLCHLDLPWLPTGLEQRVGRAARPGAARAHVQTYIPYIRRGGVEHIVSVLASRGAEHHQILDSFEGVQRPRAPSPPSSARSPARSPTARTTPATPPPPPGCVSRPASSAPEHPHRCNWRLITCSDIAHFQLHYGVCRLPTPTRRSISARSPRSPTGTSPRTPPRSGLSGIEPLAELGEPPDHRAARATCGSSRWPGTGRGSLAAARRSRALGLPAPAPDRAQWPAFQRRRCTARGRWVRRRPVPLERHGPPGLCVCVFGTAAGFAGVRPPSEPPSGSSRAGAAARHAHLSDPRRTTTSDQRRERPRRSRRSPRLTNSRRRRA